MGFVKIDKMTVKAKERPPENEKFNLEKRIFGGVERSWSEEGFEKAIALSKNISKKISNELDIFMLLKLLILLTLYHLFKL